MNISISEKLKELSLEQQLSRYQTAMDALKKYDNKYIKKLGDKSQEDIKTIMEDAEIILPQDIIAYSRTSRFINCGGLRVKIEQCQKDITLLNKLDAIPEYQILKNAQHDFDKATKNLHKAKEDFLVVSGDKEAYWTLKRLDLIR